MKDQCIETSIAAPAGEPRLIHSRRRFLSAAVLGSIAGAVLPGVLGRAFAENGGGGPLPQPFDPGNITTDVDVLNYALTLEHLEATFYRQQLERFEARDFRNYRVFDAVLRNLARRAGGGGPKNRGRNRGTNTGTGAAPGHGNNNGNGNGGSDRPLTLYNLLLDIRDHEEAHVQTLTQVIQSLGGTPVGPLEYNFGVNNVREFLALAQVFENTGVSAYDGAIALIQSPDLQTAGATIATVEARHAAFLNLVNGDNPFPRAFDEPLPPATVIAAIQPFIAEPQNGETSADENGQTAGDASGGSNEAPNADGHETPKGRRNRRRRF